MLEKSIVLYPSTNIITVRTLAKRFSIKAKSLFILLKRRFYNGENDVL